MRYKAVEKMKKYKQETLKKLYEGIKVGYHYTLISKYN